MDDFISRQAAIKAVDFEITYLTAFNLATGEVTHPFEERNKGLMDGIEALKKVPAAVVRPVVHAEWVQVMGKYDKLFRCSKCHFVPIETHYFCPNCGADMREVGTDG